MFICPFHKPSLCGITCLVKKAFFPHFMAGRGHQIITSECWSGARVGQDEPLTLGCQPLLPSPTLGGSESGMRGGSWECHQVKEQDMSPPATQSLPLEVRSPSRLGSTHHRPFPRKSGVPLLQPSPPHIHLHCTPPPRTPALHVFLHIHTVGKNALSAHVRSSGLLLEVKSKLISGEDPLML